MTLAYSPEVVAQARASLVGMMKAECLSLQLQWYEAYEAILTSEAKEVAIFGGVRGSKSNVDALKVWFHLKRYLERPGLLYWIVGHTYKAAEKEFSYLHEWAMKKGLLLGNASMPDRDAWRMTLKNGAVIETRSGEHPERLASDAPDLILVVEAGKCKPGVRKACRQRALEKDAQIYYSGTFEEEEDDASSRYVWFEELDQEFAPEKEGWGTDFQKFSLPSWTNLFIFPGGWENPKIQWAWTHEDEYTFNRKYAGIPGEVQHAIYPLIQHNEERLIVRPQGMRFITFRGGSDYGEDHPSSLVVVGLDERVKPGATDNRGRWSEQRDAWVTASWWTGDLDKSTGLRGSETLINANRRRLQDDFPGLSRWVTDPLQGYMAKSWGGTKAPGSAGSREVRVGMVKTRLANMTLWFDRNGEGVPELYQEMQRVKYRVTSDGQLVNAREKDDRTAALENAIWGLSTQTARLPVGAKYG